MNENIAFSPIEAEKLNKKVRDTLAEHLFVLCNYNPDSIMVFSEDARFMQASLNMYKFLVDAGICNNLRSIGKKYSINYDYVRLENIVKNINSIRSTLGHNLDERNGTEEDKEAVEQWFLKVVGKKQLTNAEEYKKVVEEIEKYGEESVAILTDFIEAVGKSGKKNEIIEEWENLIINLQEILRKSSFSSSALKNIGEKIDENEKIINEKKDKVAFFSEKSVDTLKTYDYWDYYMYILPAKIEEKLASGVVQSLLPQDVVQQIIEEDFDGVPI